MRFAGKKKSKEESIPDAEEKEKGSDEKPPVIMVVSPSGGGDAESKSPRCVGLVGDITEEKSSEVLYGLLSLRHTAKKLAPVDPEDPESELKEVHDPIEMMISTHGGNAGDMFAIYDIMRLIKDEGTAVNTFGVGKVMSAGVLVLAAGTKGNRKIGKHCRVMIHGVSSGAGGQIQDLDNEMEEIKQIEDQYISALAAETDMTKRYIKNLMKKKLNVYIGAQEAVDLGIADIIF